MRQRRDLTGKSNQFGSIVPTEPTRFDQTIAILVDSGESLIFEHRAKPTRIFFMLADIKKAACLSHAARNWLPLARSGKPVHPSVLTRWADRGIQVNDRRVFLHTWRVGGQRMTTKAAIEAFITELNSGTYTGDCEDFANSGRRAHEACVALEKLGC